MSNEPNVFPTLSELRYGLKIWTGEARFGPGHYVSLGYLGPKNPASLPENTAALRAVVERVFNNESDYRLKAAEAWLPRFHDESDFAHLSAKDLASAFVLIGIVASRDPHTIILEHHGPSDKTLRSWFNADGSLHHISGHI